MSESKILSREVINEWAARGQRGKRTQSRRDELQLAAKIGGPIKAELISLATPLMDCISKRGLAGVSIPIQDAAEAKDIHVDCYPLHEEIQCVLDKWGCIYIEVDSSTSRQRLADSHEAIRAEIESLRSDRDNWKDAYDRLHERYQNVSGLSDAAEKALDVAKARVLELEQLTGEDKLHLFGRLKNEEAKANNRETAGCKSCRAAVDSLRRERDELASEEPGAPLGRLNAIAKFAQEQCGHHPVSAKPAELTVIETVVRLTSELAAAIEAGKADKALFAWLAETQYDLHTHRELSQLDNQYFIWWTVIDRRNKLSLSHPYGSPQEAIRQAMQAAQVEKPE